MRIIDNKKDYYDYLSGIYGEDPLAVYDRRGSVPFRQYKSMFSPFWDPVRVKFDQFLSGKLAFWWEEDCYLYLCVEAGRRQWFFRAKRKLLHEDDTVVELSLALHGCREVRQKHAKSPLAIFVCECRSTFDAKTVRYWKRSYLMRPLYHIWETEPLVENPILDGSFIASLVPAEEIWQALYEYIMSLNEKDITDQRPDSLKIESAGFDTKTSFRNIKD